MRVIKKVLILLLIISIFNFVSNALPIVNASSMDQSVTDAEDFLKKGNKQAKDTQILNPEGIYNAMNLIYGIVLVIAIAIAVIRGILIGMQIILGTVQERADAKALLIPYLWIVVAIAFGSIILRALLNVIMAALN